MRAVAAALLSSLASSAPDSTCSVRVGRVIEAKNASTSGLARSPRAMAARTPPVNPMLKGGVGAVTSCERSAARIAATASALARDSCFDFPEPGRAAVRIERALVHR